MRVLITRPEADARPLAEGLAERGIDSVAAPLLVIVDEPNSDIDLAGVQALLFTSANGVRAFASKCADRTLPALAVGDATARAARDVGFSQIESAGGDVDDLANLVRRRCAPADGVLLHVAGSAVAGDLQSALAAAGFEVRRVVAYRAEVVAELPAAAKDALAGNSIDAALFFSPRTAAAFVTLARDAGLADSCRTLNAIALSSAVAAALADLPWRARVTAPTPTVDGMISCLVAVDDR